MTGDLPCQRPCHNTYCRYCAFGQCMDNAVCDERLPMPEREDDSEKEGDDD